VYQYQIRTVRQVVAGDDLVLDLDLGFRLTFQAEVNLSNAQTSGYGPKGNQARTFTEKWLAEEHGPFTVQVAKDRKDNYEVQIFNAEGADLGDDLVTAELGERIGS
jgi:endonuclease YncB( thermonuclease family)